MIKFTFANVPISEVSKAIYPPSSDLGFSLSSTSSINRHDVEITSSGLIHIHVDVVEMSDDTKQSLINQVPAKHIQTRDA